MSSNNGGTGGRYPSFSAFFAAAASAGVGSAEPVVPLYEVQRAIVQFLVFLMGGGFVAVVYYNLVLLGV
jgi:hypothetical protein